ncbi:hypothetical protein [Klebsiella pneumoniae IS10]|nr:hypothetical protein [Klebsiella pneumoniae IS10]
MDARKRHQHQANHRGKQQLRRQRRIDLAFLLPATHRPQHHLKTLLAEAGIHMLAQNRHLADDLLHPQRREPGVFLRHMPQRLDHHRQRQHRVLWMIDKDAADVIAQRHKALLNQLSHQRIPRAEVVMQHRRRHPGLFGDGRSTIRGPPRRGQTASGRCPSTVRGWRYPVFYRAADPGGGEHPDPFVLS